MCDKAVIRKPTTATTYKAMSTASDKSESTGTSKQASTEPKPKQKKLALIAHDSRKEAMVEWARHNKDILGRQVLFGTGTTGSLINKEVGLNIHCFKSGPLGGDQQVGAKISDGEIDFLIFFWDPLAAQPHDVDVKALLRLAVYYNIPVACNRSTADYMVTSRLFE